jgi:hypothetical protein
LGIPHRGEVIEPASNSEPQQEEQMFLNSSVTPSASSDAHDDHLRKVRQEAAEYISRFDLRQVLQQMFQQVIKERPDKPFEFMQAFLREGPGKPLESSTVSAGYGDSGDAGAGTAPAAPASAPVQNVQTASVEADAEEEAQRIRLLQQYEQQISEKQSLIDTLQKQLENATASVDRGTSAAETERTELQSTQKRLEQQIDEQRAQISQYELQLDEQRDTINRYTQQIDGQIKQIVESESRIANLETQVGSATNAAQDAATAPDAAVSKTAEPADDERQKVAELEQLIDKQAKQISGQAKQIEDSSNRIADLEMQVTRAAQAGATETKSVEQTDEELQKFAGFEKQIKEQRAIIESHVQQIARQAEMMEASSKKIEDLEAHAATTANGVQDPTAAKPVQQTESVPVDDLAFYEQERCRKQIEEQKATLDRYEQQVAGQAQQIEASANRIVDLEKQVEAGAKAVQEVAASKSVPQSDEVQQRAAEYEQQLEEQRAATDRYVQQIAGQINHIQMLENRVADLETQVVMATKKAQEAASAKAVPKALPAPVHDGRATPGDEAAGGARGSPPPAAGQDPAKTTPPQTTPPLVNSTAQAFFQPNASGASMQTMQWTHSPMQASGGLVSNASTEVNTHMLSQLLASTYAPPVPPTTYFEPREDIQEDIQTLELNPQGNAELLVDVIECADKQTNGTFAWVGSCNDRPLYRLLGPQPRYLYYAEVDPAWAGWWIADKMGSEDYVEWFREPVDAVLPVYCRKGELGSRVVEAKLTREVVQKISKIGNQAEKLTVRTKLTEAFGATFTKLDGSQRGLMSKTSPVVGVAHALEMQQRAIQLLHSQLSAETQRREAAETHAQTMEEAFETLQLRIQAQLPGSPAAVKHISPAAGT